MLNTQRSRVTTRIIATLYALAICVAGVFAQFHQHGDPGLSRVETGARFCSADDTFRSTIPHQAREHDCAACVLAAPQRDADIPRTQLDQAFETATSFHFSARLGRDLDDAPADLRSRAPPRHV